MHACSGAANTSSITASPPTAHSPPCKNRSPSGAIHCLNGNLIYALIRLGFGDDARVQTAIDWLARSITGEGEFKYLKSGTCGPGFCCSANEWQSCGWGANKALRALLAVPEQQRTPAIRRALDLGAEFLLSRDPAVADYPYTQRVSSTWFKLGFPLTYWSDVLETVANLVDLGYGDDPRLATPSSSSSTSRMLRVAGNWKTA